MTPRFSPEQLDSVAALLDLKAKALQKYEAGSGEREQGDECEQMAIVCRQSAHDARVIAQLRQWLESHLGCITDKPDCHCRERTRVTYVLAELDRLTGAEQP